MNSSYQGFEVQKHRAMMTCKMLIQIAIFCLILQIVLFFGGVQMPRFRFHIWGIQTAERVPAIYRELVWKYPAARLVQRYGLNPSFHIYAPDRLKKWPHDSRGYVTWKARELTRYVDYDQVLRVYRFPFLFSFLSWFSVLPLALFHFRRATSRIKDNEHIRGAHLLTEKDIKGKCKEAGILPIGSILIPESVSRRHLLIAGQTGSGKSTVLFQHLEAIQKAKRRAIVNDLKGELVERFYRPEKDIILNLLDVRGVGWTIFNEIRSKPDLVAITASLIPLGKGDERFWCTAAQEVLRGVLAYCYDKNLRTNADLWKILTSPINVIRDACRATPSGQAGYTYIQDPNSRQAIGVHAVLMSHVSWLEFVGDGPFCLRDWAARSKEGIVFITSVKEAANIMKSYLSLFADLAGMRFLSLPDNTDASRTVYLILDELGNMQHLPTVKELLTAGRSKGVVVEVGIPDFASIESVYGREDAHTIINSCGSKLVLNLGDPEAAKFFSDLASEEEYWESGANYSFSDHGHHGGENHHRQVRVRQVIMPAEIMRLLPGQGYFMLPGGNPALVTIPWGEANKRPKVHKPFLLRPDLSLEDLKLKNREVVTSARMVMEGPVPEELKAKVTDNATSSIRPVMVGETGEITDKDKKQGQKSEAKREEMNEPPSPSDIQFPVLEGFPPEEKEP